MKRLALWIVALVVAPLPQVHAAEPFDLKDGDRVVLIGNTLIEREQRYGYWELALTRRFPDRNITFRNLGWSGDTVFGEARARFGGPADGFKHLKEHVLALKPTVLIIGYGGNEAFEGPEGLPRFVTGLNTLLDALAPTGARIVLLSPPGHEDLGHSLPNPSAFNKNVARYSDALRDTAAKRNLTFADLFEKFGDGSKKTPPAPLTDNGIHFTSQGYRRSAPLLEDLLGLPPAKWRVEVAEDGKKVTASGAKVERTDDKSPHFRVTDTFVPLPLSSETGAAAENERVLCVKGLPAGKHKLVIDGKPIATATATEWAAGMQIESGPEFEQAELLRQAIVEKNRLYFYRWRPQNETYIFGFRKGEQGRNAVEIPKFDPLVADKEAEIAKLRVPAQHVYEIKPE